MNTFRWRARVWTLLAAVLAGGTLFGTCELRVRDALVNGSKSFLLGLPSSLVPQDSASLTQ
jgi:hypothetical protein